MEAQAAMEAAVAAEELAKRSAQTGKPEKKKPVKKRVRRTATQRGLLDSMEEMLSTIDNITMAELRKIPSDKIVIGKMKDLVNAVEFLAKNAGIQLRSGV